MVTAEAQVKCRLTISKAFSPKHAGQTSARPPSADMRTILINIALVLCIGIAAPARAEQHMFVVANDPDGYGIDRCLASGEKCGAAAANAYCKTQAFTAATTFHQVNRIDVTGSVSDGAPASCPASACEMVAIVCTR